MCAGVSYALEQHPSFVRERLCALRRGKMHCRLIRTLGPALVMLCLGLSLAIADIQTIKGKIQSINQNGEGFTLQTEDKKTMSFKTPPVLLEDLKPGDEVLVTTDNGEVIAVSLNKEDAD
jgi:hypothetical protein